MSYDELASALSIFKHYGINTEDGRFLTRPSLKELQGLRGLTNLSTKRYENNGKANIKATKKNTKR